MTKDPLETILKNKHEFDKAKKKIYVRNNQLYDLESQWADENGKITPDSGISELVLLLNRHPSAYTSGQTCQGHFYFELDREKIKVDIDAENNLYVGGAPFNEKYPDLNPKEIEFRYETPSIDLTIKDDALGKELYKALKAWEAEIKGSVFILDNHKGDYFISLASLEEFDHQDINRPFEEILRLNSERLKYISTLSFLKQIILEV